MLLVSWASSVCGRRAATTDVGLSRSTWALRCSRRALPSRLPCPASSARRPTRCRTRPLLYTNACPSPWSRSRHRPRCKMLQDRCQARPRSSPAAISKPPTSTMRMRFAQGSRGPTCPTRNSMCRAMQTASMAPPVCIGVHAVFSDNAYEELKAAGAGHVSCTVTMPRGWIL